MASLKLLPIILEYSLEHYNLTRAVIHSMLKPFKLSSFTESLNKDCLLVATGARLAALIDVQLTHNQINSLLAQITAANKAVYDNLFIFSIQYNETIIASYLLNCNSEVGYKNSIETLTLVDISSNSAILINSKHKQQDFAVHRDKLQFILRVLFEKVDSCSSKVHSVNIDLIELGVGISFLPTLTGFLLQYPVIYTFNCVESNAIPHYNALAMVDLQVISYQAKLDQSAIPITSFSVPKDLLLADSTLQQLLDDNQLQFAGRFGAAHLSEPNLLHSFDCQKEVVRLSQVVL
jgi:hypothetical protein